MYIYRERERDRHIHIYIYIHIYTYIYIYIYIYSSLASNVDFPIVVLIVFGGSASKVTCLFAKK